jgi:hypothetical protein
MKHLRFGQEMFQPDPDYTKRGLEDLPQENFEGVYFDMTLQSGIINGLNVQPLPVPNLAVRITKGRALYRNSSTLRGKIIEAHDTIDFDLSSYLPAGSPSTVKLYAKPATRDDIEPFEQVSNAPLGTEDYDPAFVPYQFRPLVRDDIALRVTNNPDPDEILLAEITLSAGQTQIVASNIALQNRKAATNAGALSSALARIGSLEFTVGDQETKIAAAKAAADQAQAEVNSLETTVAGHSSTLGQHSNALSDHETRIDALEVEQWRFVRAPGRNGPKSHQAGAFVITEEYNGVYNGTSSDETNTWGLESGGFGSSGGDGEKTIGATGILSDYNWPDLDNVPTSAKAVQLSVYLRSDGNGHAVWVGPHFEPLDNSDENPTAHPTLFAGKVYGATGFGTVVASQAGNRAYASKDNIILNLGVATNYKKQFKLQIKGGGGAPSDSDRLIFVLEGWWI